MLFLPPAHQMEHSVTEQCLTALPKATARVQDLTRHSWTVMPGNIMGNSQFARHFGE